MNSKLKSLLIEIFYSLLMLVNFLYDLPNFKSEFFDWVLLELLITKLVF